VVDALAWLRDDLGAFWAALRPPPLPGPGLRTWKRGGEGWRRRVHLRTGPAGDGLLFVDVTDVIHLNATAAAAVALLLDGASAARTRAVLRRRHPDATGLAPAIDALAQLVGRLWNESACPSCELEAMGRAALFSLPAGAPFKADLALTYGCNNACSHCYNEPDRVGMASLRAEQWRQVLDRLARVGVPHMIFTGGEATLHPDLPGLVEYANGLGLVCGLNTNGRRLAQPAFLACLVQAGLDHVQITLSSSRAAVHDAINGARAFEQTLRGLDAVLASPLHTITNTTIDRRNRDHLVEIVDLLHEHGVRTFAMNGNIFSGGGFADPDAIPEDEMPPLLVSVRDRAAALGMRFLWYTPTEYCRMSPVELEIGAKRCNAGEYSICIEPNGDVLPCQSFYVAAGNMLRDPWEQIWKGELFRSFRERGQDPAGSGLPEKCWDCLDLPLCGGGCRIEREAREGVRTAKGAGSDCGVAEGMLARMEEARGFRPGAALTRRARKAGEGT